MEAELHSVVRYRERAVIHKAFSRSGSGSGDHSLINVDLAVETSLFRIFEFFRDLEPPDARPISCARSVPIR